MQSAAAPPLLLLATTGCVLSLDNLWGEEPTSCELFAQADGSACADLCALYDSECLDAYDSSAAAPCTVQSQDGCLAAHSSQTCICARPPPGLAGAGQ
jgi:hypothetical protein